MTQTQFDKIKQQVEVDLGRPMSLSEEIETKALFYFAKGVELKNQLEFEDMRGPVHIREILPEVMMDIRSRMERQRTSQRRCRVVAAVRDFMGGNVTRSEYRKVSKQNVEQRRLWR